MVNPGGTGRPRLVISARLAPLPPSRSLRSLLPSVKSYTYLVLCVGAVVGATLVGTFSSLKHSVRMWWTARKAEKRRRPARPAPNFRQLRDYLLVTTLSV